MDTDTLVTIFMFLVVGGVVTKLAQAIGFIKKDGEEPKGGEPGFYSHQIKYWIVIFIAIILFMYMLREGCMTSQ